LGGRASADEGGEEAVASAVPPAGAVVACAGVLVGGGLVARASVSRGRAVDASILGVLAAGAVVACAGALLAGALLAPGVVARAPDSPGAELGPSALRLLLGGVVVACADALPAGSPVVGELGVPPVSGGVVVDAPALRVPAAGGAGGPVVSPALVVDVSPAGGRVSPAEVEASPPCDPAEGAAPAGALPAIVVGPSAAGPVDGTCDAEPPGAAAAVGASEAGASGAARTPPSVGGASA
jgi:hypothetical protein